MVNDMKLHGHLASVGLSQASSKNKLLLLCNLCYAVATYMHLTVHESHIHSHIHAHNILNHVYAYTKCYTLKKCYTYTYKHVAAHTNIYM